MSFFKKLFAPKVERTFETAFGEFTQKTYGKHVKVWSNNYFDNPLVRGEFITLSVPDLDDKPDPVQLARISEVLDQLPELIAQFRVSSGREDLIHLITAKHLSSVEFAIDNDHDLALEFFDSDDDGGMFILGYFRGGIFVGDVAGD